MATVIALLVLTAGPDVTLDPGRVLTVRQILRPFVRSAPQRAAELAALRGLGATPARPLVFFHLRKCAGSTMRSQLVRAAQKEIGARSWFIPCKDNVPCTTYQLQTKAGGRLRRTISVYGGHLFFGDVQRGLRQLARNNSRYMLPRAEFSCFTILRKPTTRVPSCWNYRMKRPAFDDLPTARIRESLRTAVDKFGHGCNNEALRIFADVGASEGVINTLSASTPAALPALSSALKNMQQCVVGTLERCEDTERVLSFYFPFLRGYIGCSKGHELRGQARRAIPAAEQAERDALVLEENFLEQAIYEYADAALDAELAIVKGHALKGSSAIDAHPARSRRGG
jgi:hypothetical protein